MPPTDKIETVIEVCPNAKYRAEANVQLKKLAASADERDAYHSVLRRVYCLTQTPEIERMIANVLGHHVNCAALEYSDQEQPCDCGGTST